MTEIKKGYDSFCRETCDLCAGPIEPNNPRIVIGTGSSFVVVYHNVCWDHVLSRHCALDKRKTLPEPRMMAREG